MKFSLLCGVDNRQTSRCSAIKWQTDTITTARTHDPPIQYLPEPQPFCEACREAELDAAKALQMLTFTAIIPAYYEADMVDMAELGSGGDGDLESSHV